MNQPMDMGAMMQGYMIGATIRTACTMMLELMFSIIPRERERLKETLNHEPTNENWEDYWQFLGELNSVQQCLQRAEDRERIRRLVLMVIPKPAKKRTFRRIPRMERTVYPGIK
jgi:hypothetical protein